MTDHLTLALQLAYFGLPITGPAAPHTFSARESLRLAQTATDQPAKMGHLKDARRSVDLALNMLTEEASGQATTTAPDVAL